jgi:hypothetical protein
MQRFELEPPERCFQCASQHSESGIVCKLRLTFTE